MLIVLYIFIYDCKKIKKYFYELVTTLLIYFVLFILFFLNRIIQIYLIKIIKKNKNISNQKIDVNAKIFLINFIRILIYN